MPPILMRAEDALVLNLTGCRGSEFQDVLAKVKSVPGRRFESDRPCDACGGKGCEVCDGKATKVWLMPPEPGIAERVIHAMHPRLLDDRISDWVRDARAQEAQALLTPLPEDSELLVPWATERTEWQPKEVNGEPYSGLKAHQRPAVALMAKVRKCILADDMGLGKTIQALSAVVEIKLREQADEPAAPGEDCFPKLVVCPNSAKGVWAREIDRWLPPGTPYQSIDATTKQARHNQLESAIAENAWIIANYEQLRVTKEKKKLRNGGHKTIEVMKEPLFETTSWLAVVADEVHRAKNRKAAQTRGLWRCTAPIMFGLTGTPLMNSPDELWAVLHWLFPKEYTSYWRFYEQYVDYYEGYFGKVITGVRNPDALRFELTDRLIRRTKDQVLDLPEKQRITVPVTLSPKQRKLYEAAEKEVWLEVEKAIQEGDASAEKLADAAAKMATAPGGGTDSDLSANLYRIPNGAARFVRLRQVLSTPALLGGEDVSAKLDAVVDRITDNAHKQHVVYAEFVDTCYILAERLRKAGLTAETYTGRTGEKDRTILEDAFQRGEIDVLVGTIGAMRESITLTAADTQHWIERAVVPAWNEQGEDRSRRIGQRNALTVYIYEAIDSVDDGRVAPINRLKERIVRTVLPKDDIKEERLT